MKKIFLAAILSLVNFGASFGYAGDFQEYRVIPKRQSIDGTYACYSQSSISPAGGMSYDNDASEACSSASITCGSIDKAIGYCVNNHLWQRVQGVWVEIQPPVGLK